MKPLFLYMKIGAALYEKGTTAYQDKGIAIKAGDLGKYYCIVVVVVDTLTLFRVTSCFWVGSEDYDVTLKVILYVACLQPPLFGLVFLRMCQKGTVWTFIQQWDDLQKHRKPYCSGFGYKRSLTITRNLLFGFITFESVCLALVNCFIPLMNEKFVDFFTPYIAPASKHHPWAKLFLSLHMISNLINFAKPAAMFILMTMFGFTIYKELTTFLEHFKNAITPSGEFKEKFEIFRLWHTKICDLVLTLDDMLSGLIFILYAYMIPSLCIVIYALLNGTLADVTIIYLTLFMSFSLIFSTSCLVETVVWINHPVS
jgi:hypothetical protein